MNLSICVCVHVCVYTDVSNFRQYHRAKLYFIDIAVEA